MKRIRKGFIVATMVLMGFFPTQTQAQINISGSDGSRGSMENSAVDASASGDGSWGSFDMEDPYAPLGNGLALLTIAGLGYIALKRKSKTKQR